MSKYKLIEKMGFSTFGCDGNIVLLADEVEAILEKATKVFKHPNQAFPDDWCPFPMQEGASHTAILICVEEIKKEPVKYTKFRHDTCKEIPVPKELIGKPYHVTFEEVIP